MANDMPAAKIRLVRGARAGPHPPLEHRPGERTNAHGIFPSLGYNAIKLPKLEISHRKWSVRFQCFWVSYMM